MIFLECIGSRASLSAEISHRLIIFHRTNCRISLSGCQKGEYLSAGIGKCIGGLGGGHAVAESGVGAEAAGDGDLLSGVSGAVGHAVVVEEAGVVGLAARYGRRMDQRDALGCCFGAGQAAGLGEEHVAGVHEQGNAVGEADGVDIGIFAEILAEAVAGVGGCAADGPGVPSPSPRLHKFSDELPGLAEAHAAGHYQIPAGADADMTAAGE